LFSHKQKTGGIYIMACFLAPMTEAIVVSIIKKGTEKKESAEGIEKSRSAFSTKLGWLSKMLWGGSLLLAVEHVWHGEITMAYPFLTADERPSGYGTRNTYGWCCHVAARDSGLVRFSRSIEIS
jgi:hypothetical protein